MKLFIIFLSSLVTFASVARTEVPDVILRGVVDLAGNHVYSLSADSGEKSSWVTEGDFFAGYQIIEFKPKESVLIIRKDGKDYGISLATGRVGQEESETDSQDDLLDAVEIEMSNLRQISQAALIFAHKNDGRLPSGETIHEIAKALAGEVGLREASFWLSRGEVSPASWKPPAPVLAMDGVSLDPGFAEQELFAFDFAAGLPTKGLPSTTPIAWTRGLREDGTWDESGPYGSAGGIIVFLGGNVTTFKDVRHDEAGGIFRLPDGTYSSNILEAFPSDVRVVGSGPGSLHGSSGRRDVGPLNSAPPDSLP